MRDDQLTRLLRTLEEPATPDAAFADRLFDNLTQVAGRPRRSSAGFLLVAALVLVGMLSVGVAVGSGLLKVPWLAVEVSPSPSMAITSLVESPSEAAIPSVVPMPVVTVPAGILPPGSQAIVAVDALHLRSDPSTTATVRSTLAKGATVLIVHSIENPMPVIADGMSWYMVQPVPGDITMSGWVSAGEGGTTYLTLSSPSTCQDLQAATVTLTQLIAAGSWHRLACLGNAQITITGVIDYRCQGGSRAGSTYEPAWLVDWCPTQTLTPAESVTQEIHDTLDMVAPPGGPAIQPRGTIVRVTGHFSDASSTDCVIENAYGYQPDWTVWEGAETLLCQEQFVITELEKTGFMELPPLG
jgi:hypothetical protein